MRLQRLQFAARLLAIVAAAAAAAFALISAVTVGQFALAVLVLAALLLRLQGPDENWRHVGAIGLVLAVATVVGVAGRLGGLQVVALLLVMVDYGLTRATRTVVLVGTGAAALTIATASWSDGAALDDTGLLWVLALVPLVGVTAGLLGGRQSMEGTAALESATAALDEVLSMAERLPAGFDRWSVATAVHLELLEASRLAEHAGHTTHLLLVQQGVLFGVGAPIARQPVGLLADLPSQRRTRQWVRVDGRGLPQPLQASLGDGRWYLHRLARDGAHGVVLVPQGIDPAALDDVREVLRPAAVALANVARFERLEDIAISAARTRVAHDLHDGVAQALTHVRFELDLLALEHDALTDEVGRIRQVADAALLEVRRTVGELRETAPFVDRLERHVELLQSFAPATIELDLPDGLDLPHQVHDDLFRVAQEALSNAVRHAGAGTIRVGLAVHNATVSLLVADDGRGLPVRLHPGVGLSAMEGRARRLGGEVVVRPRRGGGTVVELQVPLSAGGPATAETDGLATETMEVRSER